LTDEPAASLQHVLAVVEHQQQTLVAQPVNQVGRQFAAWPLLDPEHRADCSWHQLGIADRRKLHQPGAVRPAESLIGGNFQRQSRFADSTRPEQCQQR
jgi:hypothetical protein